MSTKASPEGQSPGPNRPRRILFLDDDPLRAEIFLANHPEAIWVQTAEACIARLEDAWDEVHLDHDLGGERYVDLSRDDCGMAVVRWLCFEPHPHLEATRFLIHSHNPIAAEIMAMQIQVAGFRVESRPFGATMTLPSPDDPFWNHRPIWQDWLTNLRTLALRLLGRRPAPARPCDATGPSVDRVRP